MKPVFIVGAPRSGSRIYLSLFNTHTEINMIEEPHLLNPWWLHPDFARTTRRRVGDLKIEVNVDRMLDLMYSRGYYGYFWEYQQLNRNSLKKRIVDSDRSLKSIFEAILEESLTLSDKAIPGAKYPVHVSFVPTLLAWFPDCKIIHLVRDPRAFFSSQLFKWARTSKHGKYAYFIPMLAHVIIQFTWSAKVYERHKHLANYYLARYEDVVSQPTVEIEKLCDFLKIQFRQDMLNIPVIDSSFSGKAHGISSRTLNRWKESIPPSTAQLIKILTEKYMKQLKYV